MVAKLILSLDNAFLYEYPLDKTRVSIGRRPTNDIHIDNLAVSGEHAAISKVDNDYYVEDLASTNGTLVNDQVVKKHFLQHGDIVEFGKYQLKYINEVATVNSVAVSRGADFEKTMMIRPSEMKVMERKLAPAPTPTPTPTPTSESIPPASALMALSHPVSDAVVSILGRIQVLNGSSVGRELVLNKALITLGKAGIQVAVITKRSNGYFITHVEGKVFPVVNGISTGVQAVVLKDHDVIELAGVKMEFYLDKT